MRSALAGQTEEERGFAMASSSKAYTCRGVESNPASFNDGSDLGGGGEGLGQGYLAKMAARAKRKAGSSAQPHVREFHKARH